MFSDVINNIRGFQYENANLLWFLFLLLPLIVWYVFNYKKTHPTVKVSGMQDFQEIKTSSIVYLQHIPFIFKLLALALFIIALARPVTFDSYTDSTSYGVDIVLSMDVSGSMKAQDLRPNRLEAAKDVAATFINTRSSDRIGLVVFSGESFTQSPITTDHATLLNLLDELESGMIEDGTAIGMGIASGVSRLKTSKAISKVIVLLTDGVNNSGDIDPLTAAELAKKYGIRIYTIGVGTRGKAPFPVETMFGTQLQYFDVEIDEAVLSKIAKTTDGKYFRATNKKELLNIYETIDSLEKTKIEDFKHTQKTEEYWRFLIAGLIALCIDFILRLTVFKRFP